MVGHRLAQPALLRRAGVRLPRPVRPDSHHAARASNHVRHAPRNLRPHAPPAPADELFHRNPVWPAGHRRNHGRRCPHDLFAAGVVTMINDSFPRGHGRPALQNRPPPGARHVAVCGILSSP